MSALNVLIVGAGVCGPALAIFLQRANPHHSITVIERWPTLRAAGQQIDLRSQGLRILKKMGLFERMTAQCVNETGLEMFNANGRSVGLFGVNPAGEKRATLTNEYEIMRGDMVRVLYEESVRLGGVSYEFGKTVTELAQSDQHVNVTFSDGRKDQFDLVVAADGLGSRTRRLAFGEEQSAAAFRSLGVHTAYYSIPRVEGEDSLAKGFIAPGRRMIMTRTSGKPNTQVLLFTLTDNEGTLKRCYKEPLERQKEAFTEAFKGAGWQTQRLLDAMETTDDFYAFEMGQMKMDTLHTGRVVLLGDAGYCPAPFTGMGTECSLVGAYVLAGELSRGQKAKDVEMALQAYEELVRPAIKDFQTLPITVFGFLFPSSWLGVWLLNKVTWGAAKINQMWWSSSNKAPTDKAGRTQLDGKLGYDLPDYPELNLAD